MNPGNADRLESVRDALGLIAEIEGWLSHYRPDSEISQLNTFASSRPVPVRSELLELLSQAKQLSLATDGAFDIASGALTQLWKSCRAVQKLPDQEQIDAALARCGSSGILLDRLSGSVQFSIPELSLDPGGIGKGYALDIAGASLTANPDAPGEFLIHGGHSSLLARGGHFGHPGWPIGIGNPLFTNQRLATVVLVNGAMATSGSNIQYFRHNGRRYGHLLDPRTGWPVDGMLSATVFSASAAVADALSTAFFVMGAEKARLCCENLPGTGAILVPFPAGGPKLEPIVVGSIPAQICWDSRQILRVDGTHHVEPVI